MSTPSISAMDFRANPGTILDRVDYRKESFLIKRAGKPKAVLIPISLYQIVENARKRLFASNKHIQKTFADVKIATMERELNKAIIAVRNHGTS